MNINIFISVTYYVWAACAATSHKMRARVTPDDTNCSKNSTFDYFGVTNPITEKGIQLRSPTPIMVPDSCLSCKITDAQNCFN